MSLILTDIDGVVLQWESAYENYMKSIGLDPLHFKDRIHKIDPKTLGITFTEESRRFVEQFQSDPIYGNLPPFEDALRGIHRLHSEGWTFIGITCCGTNETIVRLRHENIEKYFPNIFTKIHTLEVYDSKENCLKQYEPAVWVDDIPRHVLSGINCNHETYWLKRYPDFGHFDPRCSIVSNWDEIIDHLNWSGYQPSYGHLPHNMN